MYEFLASGGKNHQFSDSEFACVYGAILYSA